MTVDGKTVDGTGMDSTVYISEVVPKDEAAYGCKAEGTYYSNQQYTIRGWVLGKDGESKKDDLFITTSSFTPGGEYLDDIDGTGVRYYRVVTKKSKNIYYMFIQIKLLFSFN